RVALHLLLDLESRDRPPFGHQERDQRELADELLGVLGHGESSIRVNRWRTIRLPRQRRDGFPLFASLAPRRTAAGYAASPSPRAREAGDVLDRAADRVVAERDLALELAQVGELDRAAGHRVGLDLADVVQ